MKHSVFSEAYKNEDDLCQRFIKNLDHYKLHGLLRPCIYFHITNEQPRQKYNTKQERAEANKWGAIVGQKLNRMGRRSGVLDYEFIWKDALGQVRIAFLEAKHEDKGLLQSQKDFIEDCKQMGIPTGVFRNVQQGIRFLEDWGIIKQQTY